MEKPEAQEIAKALDDLLAAIRICGEIEAVCPDVDDWEDIFERAEGNAQEVLARFKGKK